MNNNYSKYIGQLLDNRYMIKSLVGNGGMSHVFLADDTVMQREVAIKILKDTISSDEVAVKRFVNETTAISMLKHKNIISLYDVSVKSDVKYIVMEYVKGISLKSYIEEKGVLPFAETEKIAIQILSALSHAHSKGIIHRDIKPQNIIMDTRGVAKVADFGIAKIPGNETISLYDKAIGTVNYINPEQACGKSIDARSDIYSFGTMLYEMSAGRIPFIADTPIATAYMQIHEKPIKPSVYNPDIPKGLEQIILKAIKKNPENRFQTANEMLTCLERVLNNPDVTFDFIFDEAAETEPFNDAAPREISEILIDTGSVVNGSGHKPSQNPPTKIQKIHTDKKRQERKSKKRVEIEEIIIRKKSGVSMFFVILGILSAVVCVCLVVLLYVFENYILKSMTSNDAVTIVVDDFQFQTYSEELHVSLEEAGYDVIVEWMASSEYLANTIVSQVPEADEHRVIIPGERKCELVLTVSSGENLVSLNNYVGMDHREAMIHMNALGLNVKIVRQINPVVSEGRIISTYPGPGSVITADTLITVYVSEGTGNNYVTVPDFKGMTSVQLDLALIKYNLIIGTVSYSYSDTVQKGCVISQSVFPGTAVPSGVTRIDFVVSLGSEPVIPDINDGNQPSDPDLDNGFENDPDNNGFEG